MLWEYSRHLYAIIGVAGGIALMIGSLSSKSTAARWAKRALFLAGFSVLVWGLLFLFCLTYSSAMPDTVFYLLDHYKAVVGGTSIGILVTLFLSGELNLRKWLTKNRHNPSLQPTRNPRG